MAEGSTEASVAVRSVLLISAGASHSVALLCKHLILPFTSPLSFAVIEFLYVPIVNSMLLLIWLNFGVYDTCSLCWHVMLFPSHFPILATFFR